jgi:hypothetical protein
VRRSAELMRCAMISRLPSRSERVFDARFGGGVEVAGGFVEDDEPGF